MGLDQKTIEDFQRDGAAVLRGVFSLEWIEKLRLGLSHNINTPGPYTRSYTESSVGGYFFGDYCN